MNVSPLPLLVLAIASCAGCSWWQSTDAESNYGGRLDACVNQAARDQPERSDPERRKTCRSQLGPAPMAIPAKSPVAL